MEIYAGGGVPILNPMACHCGFFFLLLTDMHRYVSQKSTVCVACAAHSEMCSPWLLLTDRLITAVVIVEVDSSYSDVSAVKKMAFHSAFCAHGAYQKELNFIKGLAKSFPTMQIYNFLTFL